MTPANSEVLRLIVEANTKLHELRDVARELGLREVSAIALEAAHVVNRCLDKLAKVTP